MFAVDDFDETLPGPWEWDVKRLAASLEVAVLVPIDELIPAETDRATFEAQLSGLIAGYQRP